MAGDKAIVNAEDALQSIRSGMSNEALMEKYRVRREVLKASSESWWPLAKLIAQNLNHGDARFASRAGFILLAITFITARWKKLRRRKLISLSRKSLPSGKNTNTIFARS